MLLSEWKRLFISELPDFYSPHEKENLFYLVVEDQFKYDRIAVSINMNQSLSEQQENGLKDIFKRLVEEEPIQYILGYAWFDGLKLLVNSDVLIPRQETEELVSWIANENIHAESNILDICSGSGCIGIALKKRLPFSNVYGLDISQKAIDISQKNSKLNSVHIDFIQLDILNSDFELSAIDIIVSNPPYVKASEAESMKPNVLKHEPHIALFVSDSDPLVFYRRISKIAFTSLKPGGKLYFEINENLAEETSEIMKKAGFSDVILRKDLNNRFRMISGRK